MSNAPTEKGQVEQVTFIPPRDWILIGKGGFGEVYKGTKDGKIKAFKIIQSIDEAFKESINTFKCSSHHHVITIHNATIISNQSAVCIEMDYYENGSLHDYFIKKHIQPSATIIYSILNQVIDALVFLKKMHNMVHRDIKPGNILIRKIDLENDFIDICLADFGMAKNTPGLSENSSLLHPKGTDGYIAPELFMPISEQRYSLASDIFALGATLFKLMSGISLIEIPYYQWSQEVTKRNCSKLEEMIIKMLRINRTTPSELIHCISKMLISNPIIRQQSVVDLFPQYQVQEPNTIQVAQPINIYPNNIPQKIQKQQHGKPLLLANSPNGITKPKKTTNPKEFLKKVTFVHKIHEHSLQKQTRANSTETKAKIEEILRFIEKKGPSFMLSDKCIRKIFFLSKTDLELFSKILDKQETRLNQEEVKIVLKFIIDKDEMEKCTNNIDNIRTWIENIHVNPPPDISTDILLSIKDFVNNKEEYKKNIKSLIDLLYGRAGKEQRLERLCKYNSDQVKELISALKNSFPHQTFPTIIDSIRKENPSELARKLIYFCLSTNITQQ